MHYIVEQLGLGAVIGVSVGLLGGALLAVARRRNWVANAFTMVG